MCSQIYCKIPKVTCKRNLVVVCSNPCTMSNLLNFSTLVYFGSVMNYFVFSRNQCFLTISIISLYSVSTPSSTYPLHNDNIRLLYQSTHNLCTFSYLISVLYVHFYHVVLFVTNEMPKKLQRSYKKMYVQKVPFPPS